MIEKLKGHYVYGEPYPDGIKGTSVPFEIEWNLEDGIIAGTCVDDEGKKIFDTPSTIMGFIDNNIISFIKKYPKYWEIDEYNKTTVFDEIPPQEIHYSGLFIDDHFEGDWEMTATYIVEEDEENEEEIVEYLCTGTWILKKVE